MDRHKVKKHFKQSHASARSTNLFVATYFSEEFFDEAQESWMMDDAQFITHRMHTTPLKMFPEYRGR